MITNLFLSAAAIAGFAVIWRNLLQKSKSLQSFLNTNFPYFLSYALQCGSCFTYWLTLLFLVFFNPLKNWSLPVEFEINKTISELLMFLINWMILALVAVTMRFVYVAIQEIVNYFTHQRQAHHQH
jgi:hypothetical protein